MTSSSVCPYNPAASREPHPGGLFQSMRDVVVKSFVDQELHAL
ncbi:MAG: hypothetical protein R3320_02635 [Nitriliruptorales bacterium]|nr:hypothetical protein [Nitriliruptorales bacterium]